MDRAVFHSLCPSFYFLYLLYAFRNNMLSDTLICNNRTNFNTGYNKYVYSNIHSQNQKQIQCDHFDSEYARQFYACHGSKEKLLLDTTGPTLL